MNNVPVSPSLPVRVKRVGSIEVSLPKYQTSGSVGFDLCAAILRPINLFPGKRELVPSGLAFQIPAGYEGQIRPRSGLALKYGISIVNSPGTIDFDYTGEVSIIIINHGFEVFTINPLDRIAQMIISKVERADLILVDELDETVRGAGGFGSTSV
jgi:dUTP pyrophosphatase